MSGQSKSFWNELKERRVVRVAVVYAVVAWAVLQVAEMLAGILSLPLWAPQLVLMLLTLGFPVALVMAWAFQMTSGGVQRADPLPEGARSRLPFVAGLTVGMLSVSGVAFIFFGGEGADGEDPGALGTRSELRCGPAFLEPAPLRTCPTSAVGSWTCWRPGWTARSGLGPSTSEQLRQQRNETARGPLLWLDRWGQASRLRDQWWETLPASRSPLS